MACYGYGEPFNKDHRKVCKAKDNTCTYCNKKTHFDECCWAKQKAGNKMKKAPDKYPEKSRKQINRILNNSNITISLNDVEFTRKSSDEKHSKHCQGQKMHQIKH